MKPLITCNKIHIINKYSDTYSKWKEVMSLFSVVYSRNKLIPQNLIQLMTGVTSTLCLKLGARLIWQKHAHRRQYYYNTFRHVKNVYTIIPQHAFTANQFHVDLTFTHSGSTKFGT